MLAFLNMLVLFLFFIPQMVGMYVCALISMFVNGDEV